MAAKFRKIDPRIWSDEKFRTLPPLDKLIALNVLASSQLSRIGIMAWSSALAAEQCGLEPIPYRDGIRRVCHTLSWGYDEGIGALFLPRWWKYNQPDNPKHLAGILGDLHDVPKTPLLQAFYASLQELPEHLREAADTVCHTVCHTVSHTVSPQEQEQEQEQYKRKAAPSCSEMQKTASSEPTATATPDVAGGRTEDTSAAPVLTFPVVGRGGPHIWHLTREHADRLREAFPGVDIEQAALQALRWCEANPKKQKTPKGMAQFLYKWMAKEQNRGGTASAPLVDPNARIAATLARMGMTQETK